MPVKATTSRSKVSYDIDVAEGALLELTVTSVTEDLSTRSFRIYLVDSDGARLIGEGIGPGIGLDKIFRVRVSVPPGNYDLEITSLRGLSEDPVFPLAGQSYTVKVSDFTSIVDAI